MCPFFPHHVILLEAPFRTPPSHLINSCPHKDLEYSLLVTDHEPPGEFR